MKKTIYILCGVFTLSYIAVDCFVSLKTPNTSRTASDRAEFCRKLKSKAFWDRNDEIMRTNQIVTNLTVVYYEKPLPDGYRLACDGAGHYCPVMPNGIVLSAFETATKQDAVEKAWWILNEIQTYQREHKEKPVKDWGICNPTAPTK